MLLNFIVLLGLALFVQAEDAGQEGVLPVEKFEDYLQSHGKMQSLGVVDRRSEKSDNNFYPKYMKGQIIESLCITSQPDYQPCLGTFTAPKFAAPEGHQISYYVWKSDKKAAVGYFISTFRATTLKYSHEFEELKSLRKLRIIGRGITNVADAFYECRQLDEVDLHSNGIKRLIGNNFLWTEKLRLLNLADNKISTITEDSFNSLKLLEELDLSGNPLKTLNWKILNGLEALKVLRVNGSQLDQIDGFSDEKGERHDGKTSDLQVEIEGMDDRRPFRDALLNLIRMELQDNKLASVHELLARVPNVQYLDLSQNLLERIEKRSFLNLRKLAVLLLNDNHLQLPYKEWFYTIVKNNQDGNTTRLNISSNQWKCNCPTITFHEYCVKLGNQNAQELVQSMQIQCYLPESMKGKFIKDVVEQIRIDNECPRASNKEESTESRQYDAGDSDARHYYPSGNDNTGKVQDGFLADRYVSITLILALLIAFLAHLVVQHYSRNTPTNLNLPPHTNPANNTNPPNNNGQPQAGIAAGGNGRPASNTSSTQPTQSDSTEPKEKK